MRIIIAGTRSFDNYELLKEKLNLICARFNIENPIIISGNCSGADKLGERYAKEFNLRLKIFPAEWETYGKSAGPIRNAQMAKAGDCLICFWDGQSKGTLNMIEQMHKLNKPAFVISYK